MKDKKTIDFENDEEQEKYFNLMTINKKQFKINKKILEREI